MHRERQMERQLKKRLDTQMKTTKKTEYIQEYRRGREKQAGVVASGSNLLSVSWLNKSASLYFSGALNNSHTNTHIKRNILC